MAKLSQIQIGRNDGMVFAYEIVKKAEADGKNPVEVLGKEIKMRNATGISARMVHEEIQQLKDELLKSALQVVYMTSSVLMSMTLRDLWGFGKDRIQKTLRRYLKKMYCIDPNYPGAVTLEDMNNCLKEEVGIDILAGQIGITDDEAAQYRRQQLYSRF